MYFKVLPPDDIREAGLASTDFPGNVWYPLLDKVMDGGSIEDWQAPEYTLKGSILVDYQPEVNGLRLCSEKMKRVLEDVTGPQDTIQWLPAVIKDDAGHRHPYWVLHFPDRPDILDVEETEYRASPLPVKAAISQKRAEGRHVMWSPDGSTVAFVVSEETKDELEKAECTGVLFSLFPSV